MAIGVGTIGALGRIDVPSTSAAHPVFDSGIGDVQFYGVIDDYLQLGADGAFPDDATVLESALNITDPTDPAIVLYLKMEEGTGNSVLDSGPNNLDGTRENLSQWVAMDGGTELRGQRKRRVWGRRRQVAGTLVDRQRLVYQVNAAETQAITPTQGGYASLTSDGDFDNIYDWTPAPGHYATQLSEGLVRFQSDPTAGGTLVLAFDVDGTVDPVHGWSAVAAHVMRDLVTNEGGLSGVDDVDTGAVDEHATARPDAVGQIAGSEPVTVSALLTPLAQTGDGWWTFLRDGRWSIGLRSEPTIPEVALTPNMVLEQGIRRIASPPPAYRQRLSYRPYEVTVPLEQVNISIDEVDRGQYGESVRYYSTATDSAVRSRFGRLARIAEGATLYDLESAARAEAARRQALDRLKREVYQVPLLRGLLQYRVGQVVSLYLDDDRLLLGRRALTANRSGRRYLALDGSSGYVSVASPPAVGTGSFTIETWVRLDADGLTSRSIVTRGTAAAAGSYFLGLRTAAETWGQLKFTGRGAADGAPSNIYSATALASADGWRHVAVVIDRTANTITFYIDGALNYSQAYTPVGSLDSSGGDLVIGASASGASQHFQGAMSDVRLWQSARTAAQILAGMDDWTAGPAGNWRLDDGAGLVAEDSGGSADGVIHPNVTWRGMPTTYSVRNFAVGGYDEDSESEKAVLYLWGLAAGETEFAL